MALVQVAGLKARYFVYLAIGCLALSGVVSRDLSILDGSDRINNPIIPFQTEGQAYSALLGVYATFIASAILAIIIAVSQRRQKQAVDY